MKIPLIVLACLTLSVAAYAQDKFAWEQPADTLAQAQGFAYHAWIDFMPVTVVAHTCTGPVTPDGWPCTAPIPALPTGSHMVALIAVSPQGKESLRSNTLTFVLEAAPAPPKSLRIISAVPE